MEPHHPNGRVGDNLYYILWVHRKCHEWIHAHPKEAKKSNLMKTRENRFQDTGPSLVTLIKR